jgi:hypothetical protein
MDNRSTIPSMVASSGAATPSMPNLLMHANCNVHFHSCHTLVRIEESEYLTSRTFIACYLASVIHTLGWVYILQGVSGSWYDFRSQCSSDALPSKTRAFSPNKRNTMYSSKHLTVIVLLLLGAAGTALPVKDSLVVRAAPNINAEFS